MIGVIHSMDGRVWTKWFDTLEDACDYIEKEELTIITIVCEHRSSRKGD